MRNAELLKAKTGTVLKDIYIVTHTQSKHHVEGLVGGWYDSGLTDHGRDQAACIGRRMRELIPEGSEVEIYSSDLMRARQTADAVARCLGVTVEETSDLRERSYGSAGGKLQAWLDERVVFAPKVGNRMDHRDGIADAETKREFAGRIYRAMDRIIAMPCQTQVIVTHGYSMTFAVAAWIKLPIDDAGYINMKSTSGGITHLHEDDVLYNRYVMRLNDVAHLEAAQV